MCPMESGPGLQNSWDKCSEPEEIRVGLGARQRAKRKSGRGQHPVKVCLSFLRVFGENRKWSQDSCV